MLLGLYRAATTLGGPAFHAALRVRAGRGKEDPARLRERRGHASRPRPAGRLAWLHAASVGESLAALPLIALMLEARPGLEVLLTTGTLTSARLVERRLPARARHQYVPLDRIGYWRRFLRHWRPDAGILIESELWPNLFAEAARQRLPLALVNGRMSERSYRRWRSTGGAAARLLRQLEPCLAQSEDDARRLRALGASGVEVIGNLKLAAPPLDADPAALDVLRGALAGRPVWLAASTHPGEEAVVVEAQRALLARWPDLLLIIAPRHPARGPAIAAEARALGLTVAERSAGQPVDPAVGVYLADTLGELGLFYRLAPLALIGGSLVPHGGQNPLEAARLGCVPLFGPLTWNFDEITRDLLARDAAIRVGGEAASIAEAVGGLLADPARVAAYGERARDAALSRREVLDATWRALAPLLDHERKPHARS